MHCSVLAEEAIKSALKDYSEKSGVEIEELKDFEPKEDHHH